VADRLTATERQPQLCKSLCHMAEPGAPYLYVGVSALPLKSIPGVYAVSVNADLIQVIRLVRNPSTLALGRTWNATGVYGTLGASIVGEEVRKRV